ncbi:helix-turn-helix transcriptional regulator [Ideonella livida]|uniref:AlpA family phage regulatory protein n=1 Tax=Ideonella livida TaxID=2707176 RepID=A0A7C9PFI9_9BURK|nr:AlpA family phage regulatory protein [Ideonella livida]NDY90150.1 AlpA family phage regulatory protein [Ideonella livida]
MFTPQLVHDAGKAQPVTRDRLIRLPEVLRLVGVGKSTWYTLIDQGKAPRGVQITPRCVAWSESACMAWVQARLADAQRGAPQA